MYGFESFRKLRESIIDGLESPGGCREAIYTFFNEILMFLGASGGCCESIIEVAVKPFAHFYIAILMVL